MGSSPLVASAHIVDTERQIAQDVEPEIILGTGPDEGTVCVQVGAVNLWFSSIDQLIARLQEKPHSSFHSIRPLTIAVSAMVPLGLALASCTLTT